MVPRMSVSFLHCFFLEVGTPQSSAVDPLISSLHPFFLRSLITDLSAAFIMMGPKYFPRFSSKASRYLSVLLAAVDSICSVCSVELGTESRALHILDI